MAVPNEKLFGKTEKVRFEATTLH